MGSMVSQRPRAALLAAIALFTPWNMVSARPRPTISKTELRTDPPKLTHSRLRDVVWDLFEQEDHRRSKAPRRSLDSIFLQTKTQQVHVPGLCRYDSVRVEFESIDPKDDGPDAPVRATGLTATSLFHFLSPPAGDYEAIADYELPASSACDKLSDDTPFFSAPDEVRATGGYRSWITFLEAARSGVKFPLECSLNRTDKIPCEKLVAGIEVDSMSEIETCDAEAGMACYRFYAADDRSITVVTTGHVVPGPPSGQIIRARLDTLIVFGHARID